MHVRHLYHSLPHRPPRCCPSGSDHAPAGDPRRIAIARPTDGEGALGAEEPPQRPDREVRGAQVASRRGRRRGSLAQASLPGLACHLQPRHGLGVPRSIRDDVLPPREPAAAEAFHQRGRRRPAAAADQPPQDSGGAGHIRSVHRRHQRNGSQPVRGRTRCGGARAASPDLRGPLAGGRRGAAPRGLREGDARGAEEVGQHDLHTQGDDRGGRQAVAGSGPCRGRCSSWRRHGVCGDSSLGGSGPAHAGPLHCVLLLCRTRGRGSGRRSRGAGGPATAGAWTWRRPRPVGTPKKSPGTPRRRRLCAGAGRGGGRPPRAARCWGSGHGGDLPPGSGCARGGCGFGAATALRVPEGRRQDGPTASRFAGEARPRAAPSDVFE
mmetsp:Transcript_15927/g.47941  ORF Transcript_15927/g.47941 Transcript_15927/m.47941 type:complete len:380 (+) Transcript_15927:715-1854(+)